MPSSIARVTALDHDRMHRLVRRTCAPGPSQQRWRDELATLVLAHLQAERTVLTTDVLSRAGEPAVSATDEVARLGESLERVAHELVDAPVGSEEMREAGRRLGQLLTQHADLLTEQVLRPLELALARKEVRQLGGRYAQCRDDALHEHGLGGPPPRRLDLSRAELYELAKKAGIEGRSAMSRQDLIAELQRRQTT